MKLITGSPAIDRDEEAALWCFELAEGDLQSERRRAFDDWHEDPDNAAAFQLAAEAWDLTEAIGSAPEIVRMRSEALDSYRQGTLRRWRSSPRRRSAIWSVGAMAAALSVVIGWAAWPDRTDYHTAVGERQVAKLDDGSLLSLDADSSVEARFDSRQRSLVLTQGRARFDVAHNPLRPFTVTVGDKVVVATGTSFSVEKLGHDVRVVLFEGHVAVLGPTGAPVALDHTGGAADEVLAPGHELVVHDSEAGPARVAATDVQDAVLWQQGQVSFDDQPLLLAVERMNRYLAEPLVVVDVPTARVRVTGVFDARDASGFLDSLKQLSGVRAVRRSGRVLLTKD
ncbi:FecR family protein [Sphingomonas sp. CLY1604]|uniref:FecR family protein n=1 Tax=Sphingomonas sp. CLY1604 TaxID=3457786 RepID=UPI003FD81C21